MQIIVVVHGEDVKRDLYIYKRTRSKETDSFSNVQQRSAVCSAKETYTCTKEFCEYAKVAYTYDKETDNRDLFTFKGELRGRCSLKKKHTSVYI